MAITVPNLNAFFSKALANAAIIDQGAKKVFEHLADRLNGIKVTGTTAISSVGATVDQGAPVHQTLLTLTNTPMTLSDTNNGGGVLIYTLPKGRIQVLGSMASLAFTTTSTLASTLNTGVTVNYGLGSVITTTQNSGTLATTQQDILPTTNATASATINVAGAAATGVSAAVAYFDGTTTPIPVNLNVGVATGTDIDGDATVLVNGTIVLNWINLGLF